MLRAPARILWCFLWFMLLILLFFYYISLLTCVVSCLCENEHNKYYSSFLSYFCTLFICTQKYFTPSVYLLFHRAYVIFSVYIIVNYYIYTYLIEVIQECEYTGNKCSTRSKEFRVETREYFSNDKKCIQTNSKYSIWNDVKRFDNIRRGFWLW